MEYAVIEVTAAVSYLLAWGVFGLYWFFKLGKCDN